MSMQIGILDKDAVIAIDGVITDDLNVARIIKALSGDKSLY